MENISLPNSLKSLSTCILSRFNALVLGLDMSLGMKGFSSVGLIPVFHGFSLQ